MVKELREWNSSTHVEIRPISQQGCVFFAERHQHITELLEVQLSVLVVIMSPEQEVHIIVSKVIESEILFQGLNNVLHRDISDSSCVKQLEGVQKVKIWQK